MIDEKTIERAAQKFNPINDMLGEEARSSFKDGAYWFRNIIWHDEDEVPEPGKYILLHLLCKEGKERVAFKIKYTTIDVGVEYFDKKIQCEYFCETCVHFPFKWCYIDDLLPKGGQKDD